MRQIIFDFGELNLGFLHAPLRVFGYGLMLVLGFVLGITLAHWRARRSKEDPAAVSHVGMLALVGGILGARIAYVIKCWDDFGDKGLGSLLDFTSGGLIYYGGLIAGIAAVVGYLAAKRLPIRRYLDIVSVSLMVGLAFGRAGCLLNGCCYGGRCNDHWALGMRFPMFSPPLLKFDGRENPYSRGTTSPTPVYAHQMQEAPTLRVPAELRRMVRDERRLAVLGALHAPQYLHGPLSRTQLDVVGAGPDTWRKLFDDLAERTGKITRAQWDRGLARGDGLLRGSEHWDDADPNGDAVVDFEEIKSYFTLRQEVLTARFGGDVAKAEAFLRTDELALAGEQASLAVQPAQALGIVNALVLAGLLTAFYRIRRREGMVFAVLLVAYPITRFVEEAIRDDNPHNLASGVLTHNQWTCVILIAIGAVVMAWFSRLNASAGPSAMERLAGHRTDKNGKSVSGGEAGRTKMKRPRGQRS
ncbi:MAG: prolipoprotein diacylglyceryl transferase [Planctomycetota bacterium]|nr:prolipoprotein diacylglyceryl transferase [Planctomycetota bacterium]